MRKNEGGSGVFPVRVTTYRSTGRFMCLNFERRGKRGSSEHPIPIHPQFQKVVTVVALFHHPPCRRPIYINKKNEYVPKMPRPRERERDSVDRPPRQTRRKVQRRANKEMPPQFNAAFSVVTT
jgi:hypothetical protein